MSWKSKREPSFSCDTAEEERAESYPEMKTLSDEGLIELLQKNNHDALALLFDRHNRLVLHVASKILRDIGEAEDLMQRCSLKSFRRCVASIPGEAVPKPGSSSMLTTEAWIVVITCMSGSSMTGRRFPT